MGFAAQLAAFRDKTAAKLDEVTRLIVEKLLQLPAIPAFWS